MTFFEDIIEGQYQEGVRARTSGEKCPYERGTPSAFYWKRGYDDAATPAPEGQLRTLAVFQPREKRTYPTEMRAQFQLLTPEGQKLLRMDVAGLDCRLTTEEITAFGRHVERLLMENPFEMESRVFDVSGRKFYTEGEAGRQPGERRSREPGEIRIPSGAKIDPETGEILVPSRALDKSAPDAKKFRRACRSARNGIRALAESSGRPASVITREMMEKTA